MNTSDLISLLAAVMTGIITLSTGYFFIRSSERSSRSSSEEEVEKIASAVNASAAEARTRALTTLAERLPDSMTPEEFAAALERGLTTNIQIVTQQVEKDSPTKPLVEGLVDSYHRQALEQAKQQSVFSIIAASIGFIFILVMIAINHDSNWSDIVVRLLPGVVFEAVAVLFFRQAEQTRQRATELYDRLRADEQRTQSRAIVDSIENGDMRSIVKAQMALHMAGITSPVLNADKWLEQAKVSGGNDPFGVFATGFAAGQQTARRVARNPNFVASDPSVTKVPPDQ